MEQAVIKISGNSLAMPGRLPKFDSANWKLATDNRQLILFM